MVESINQRINSGQALASAVFEGGHTAPAPGADDRHHVGIRFDSTTLLSQGVGAKFSAPKKRHCRWTIDIHLINFVCVASFVSTFFSG